MFEFPNNKDYDTLNTGEQYLCNLGGLVFTSGERDLLDISSKMGLIIKYDLEQKKI